MNPMHFQGRLSRPTWPASRKDPADQNGGAGRARLSPKAKQTLQVAGVVGGALTLAAGAAVAAPRAGDGVQIRLGAVQAGPADYEVHGNGDVYHRGWFLRSFTPKGHVEEDGRAVSGWKIHRLVCQGRQDGHMISLYSQWNDTGVDIGHVDADGTIRQRGTNAVLGKILDAPETMSPAERAGAACLALQLEEDRQDDGK